MWKQDILPNGDLQPLRPEQVSPLRAESTQDTSKLSALPERVPSGGDKGPGLADVGGTDSSQTPQKMGLVWDQHCLSKAFPVAPISSRAASGHCVGHPWDWDGDTGFGINKGVNAAGRGDRSGV